jgi:hypothetical protein
VLALDETVMMATRSGSLDPGLRRSVDVASEDRYLMAQHDDLDREVRVLATGEPDQLEDSAERPVQERD